MMTSCGGSQSPVILLWLLGFHVYKQPSLSQSANFEHRSGDKIPHISANNEPTQCDDGKLFSYLGSDYRDECRSQVMRKAGVKMLICRVPMT